MGVSLERVQNKFACIIGELCSEPLVLSQFAVWVDLRIAEYKANGTISLDCSGESPNPKWMKGVKNHTPRAVPDSMDTGQHPHYRQDSYNSSPVASPGFDRESSQSSQPTYSRLSPDIVVVKEEKNFDEQSSCAVGRKRHSEGSDWQSEFYSPSKSRRLGNNSAILSSSAQESSSNQSLMSIINTENDTTALEQVDPLETDIFQSPMGTSQSDFNTSQGSSNTEFSPHLPTSSSPSQSTWSSQFNQSAQGSSSQGAEAESSPCTAPKASDLWLPGSSSKLSSAIRNARYKNKKKKTMSALNILEYWLRHTTNESRSVLQIPTDELDYYLAQFFSSVTKKNGQDYTAKSLESLREGIKIYLVTSGYGHCIMSSPLFMRSRHAYKDRRKQLFAAAVVHASPPPSQPNA